MANINIELDAELVVEVMVLAGINNPRDAVEAVVRDYIARGHRTEARVATGEAAAPPRAGNPLTPEPPQG
ncbi:type II toxin-antitoxin system VapB family antitoxin [Streptomyces sp. Je 1-79]|uniref:type II toxin-antitoxin system VapB family antitoxin n=1 Tax=Streptomyces sp. Je 1-79 TaxID=2943847 RepID=UPI0021A7BC3C|nr:type II toxin-antitoxin system VapB family antitoxin [Streptomyces sp. Je 1-79]MCT4353102.1 type II toxin-antitoxin system VapB family antitoxin [Streptomyces sp. Je 1-79]